MATAKHKFDLFRALHAADLRNRNYFYQLNEEEKKAFEPFMVMRWLTCVVDGPFASWYIQMINDLVNLNFSALKEHPELQWMLMSQVGAGQKMRRQWINVPKRPKLSRIHDFMLRWYPSANDQELKIILNQFTNESFVEFVHSTGLPDEDVEGIINEFKETYGNKTFL